MYQMKLKKMLTAFALFILLPSIVTAKADGEIFKVNGEQLEFQAPEGWKLAWMSGDPDGAYFAEFILLSEDINT